MNQKKQPWERIYKKAYQILGNETPIHGDCGLLCQQACCRPKSGDGMLLFPHEEQLFINARVKHQYTLSRVRQNEFFCQKPIIAICKGVCNRKTRPLACRIFPYIPKVEADQTVNIVEDPRARNICPLLLLEKDDYQGVQNETFLKKMHKMFAYLMQFDPIPIYITALYKSALQQRAFIDQFKNKGGK